MGSPYRFASVTIVGVIQRPDFHQVFEMLTSGRRELKIQIVRIALTYMEKNTAFRWIGLIRFMVSKNNTLSSFY